MKIETVDRSTGYPIDLEDVKDHLRIPTGETRQDNYLIRLITMAAETVEGLTNRALTRRTLKLYLDSWSTSDSIELPYPPLSTETDAVVKYKDTDSSTITMSSTGYLMDAVSEPGRIVLGYQENWPTEILHNVNPISIQYLCGYRGSTAVPEKLKQAMLISIADMYENRESAIVGQSVQELPTIKNLVRDYRSFKFGE